MVVKLPFKQKWEKGSSLTSEKMKECCVVFIPTLQNLIYYFFFVF